jgi:hypothetical protein
MEALGKASVPAKPFLPLRNPYEILKKSLSFLPQKLILSPWGMLYWP